MCSSYLHPNAYGAETQALSLARELVRQGTPVTIVTRRVPGVARQEDIGGVQVHRSIRASSSRRLFIPLYILSLSFYLLRRRAAYDVVHVHLADLDAWVAVRLRRLTGRKVIVKFGASSPHGEIATLAIPRRRGRLFDMLGVLRTVRRADRVIATSGRLARELAANGFRRERIVAIPNGVDEGRVAEARPFAAGKGGITLLFVGRLEQQKGLEYLIEALAALGGHPELRLCLVGDGTRRKALEGLAAAAGVGSRVEFAGKREDVRPYWSQADIFVLPSLSEGMSNSLLEAMAAGLPCVATRVAGSEDLIDDGRTGLLVEAGDAAGLAAAVESLLWDRGRAVALGLAAAQRIREGYAMGLVAARYRELYRELVSARAGGEEPCAG